MKVKTIVCGLALLTAVVVLAASASQGATAIKADKAFRGEVEERVAIPVEARAARLGRHLEGKQGGEDIASAVVIPDLGWGGTWSATGTTVGYQDDYDEACPSAATLPDVVYSYTPGLDQVVDILLCESSYMTKLFVYETDASTVVDCNTFGDPYCEGAPPRSALANLLLSGGTTYYIVIDGYQGQSGDYQIDIETRRPITAMTGHPAMADGNNGNLVLGWDYFGQDDTTVYWMGSTDNGETWPDEVVFWSMADAHPHADYYSADTMFFSAHWFLDMTDDWGGWVITGMMHPTDPDGWFAYSLGFDGEYFDTRSMDIACDDVWADSVDGDGLPWSYGWGATVQSTDEDGFYDEPFVFFAANATQNFIGWYERSLEGYRCNSSSCDLDKISHNAIAVYDAWHPDSAAWGMIVNQNYFLDVFNDTVYSGSWTYFLRDELPVLQNIRNPVVARHDDHNVVVCEYYTEDGRDIERDLACITFETQAYDGLVDFQLASMVSTGAGDEQFPEIAHVADQHYVCTFFRTDSLFRTETVDGGTTWSPPCLMYALGDAADPAEYLHLEDAPIYDLADYGNFMTWQYRDYDNIDSSSYVHYGPVTCGGCCVPPYRGDVKMDGAPGDLGIDVSDIVYLVNWMFKEGPDPECEDEVDVAGSGGTAPDGQMSIPDLVYLVNFMFKSGPLPPACP